MVPAAFHLAGSAEDAWFERDPELVAIHSNAFMPIGCSKEAAGGNTWS
ncbi:hypothetical protein ABIB66_006742 [Bradyrhizobium sp. F1.13.3]